MTPAVRRLNTPSGTISNQRHQLSADSTHHQVPSPTNDTSCPQTQHTIRYHLQQTTPAVRRLNTPSGTISNQRHQLSADSTHHQVPSPTNDTSCPQTQHTIRYHLQQTTPAVRRLNTPSGTNDTSCPQTQHTIRYHLQQTTPAVHRLNTPSGTISNKRHPLSTDSTHHQVPSPTNDTRCPQTQHTIRYHLQQTTPAVRRLNTPSGTISNKRTSCPQTQHTTRYHLQQTTPAVRRLNTPSGTIYNKRHPLSADSTHHQVPSPTNDTHCPQTQHTTRYHLQQTTPAVHRLNTPPGTISNQRHPLSTDSTHHQIPSPTNDTRCPQTQHTTRYHLQTMTPAVRRLNTHDNDINL